MTISKPRHYRRRRGNGRHRAGSRRERLRTEAEQLDYEMELHRAKREGREQEFIAEERAKLRARRATKLDEEMDAYFKQRDEAVAAGKAKSADAGGKSQVDGDANANANKADPADSTEPSKTEPDQQQTTDTKAN